MAVRDQVKDAQQLYDERAARYDDSWHPRFARHMVELVGVKAGDHILDLACGTGLVSYAAAQAVGPKGSVTGLDVSSGMLAQAKSKKGSGHENVRLFQHSITDLDSLQDLRGKTFDIVICASALVLLQHPGEAIKQWAKYLKPGGQLITDVTHPESQISHITFERVGRALDLPLPWYRVPFQAPTDLSALLKAAGLDVIESRFISQTQIDGREDLEAYCSDLERPRFVNIYTVGDASVMFDKHIHHWTVSGLADPQVQSEAREVFREEWVKLADTRGNIKEVDGVFVTIGRKP